MEKVEFKKKVKEWLYEKGFSDLHLWNIEEKQDSVVITVSTKVKINVCENTIEMDLSGRVETENKEETIRTAVLAMNEQLNQRLDDVEHV